MKVSDMMAQGNFFLLVFCGVYFIAERLALVPLILLVPTGGSGVSVDTSDVLSIIEEFIMLLILLNIVWLVTQIIYWRIFRKEKIQW